MGGIAGLMTGGGEAPEAQTLQAMSAAPAHRGPDSAGEYGSGNVAMATRRLAVGAPVAGGATLVANGAIYNARELHQKLGGAEGSTASGFAPALQLYGKSGAGFARDLRGMYAIAIHDPATGHLLLARDPFGIKPLYYAENRDGFAFASEPRALITSGVVQPRINEVSRNEMLQLQFSTGPETVYQEIRRVLPGETLVVAHGRIVERERIRALPQGGPQDWPQETAMENLDRALADSIAVHLRADEPSGMFLTGAVESTVLLTLMAHFSDQPVLALTAAFDERGAGADLDYTRAIAKATGARHVEVKVTESDFWQNLPHIAAAMDDPAADYGAFRTYMLARAAGREVKMVMCGDGGDEMFAGYGRYRSVIRPWWRGGRTIRSRGIFDGLGVLRSHFAGWRDGIAGAEATESTPGRTELQIAQAIDCADWLPNDTLTALDRCLAAHGIEGRTPFLDPAVTDIAFRLDDGFKVHRGLGKWQLRQWLADRLPVADSLSRRRSFAIPVTAWIARQGTGLGPLVAASPGVQEICDPNAVTKLFRHGGKRQSFASWVLLFYALWHRANVEGRKPEGDVFDCLAAR